MISPKQKGKGPCDEMKEQVTNCHFYNILEKKGIFAYNCFGGQYSK